MNSRGSARGHPPPVTIGLLPSKAPIPSVHLGYSTQFNQFVSIVFRRWFVRDEFAVSLFSVMLCDFLRSLAKAASGISRRKIIKIRARRPNRFRGTVV